MSNLWRSGRSWMSTALSSHLAMPVASVVLFVVLGAALYTVYVDTGYMLNRVRADFNEIQLTLARQAAQGVADDLRDLAVELERLKVRVEARVNPADAAVPMQSTLDYFGHRGVVEIGLVSPTGEVLAGVRAPEVASTHPDEVLRTHALLKTSQTLVGPLYVEVALTGRSSVYALLTTAIPLEGSGFRLLFAKLDITSLVGTSLRSIRSGQSGYAWSIDEQGTFLYHTDAEFVGRNAFLARHEREPYISFRDINHIMKERMLKGEEGTGNYVSGWHRGHQGEIEKLIAYTPVRSVVLPSQHLWSVAVSAPESEIAGSISEVRTRHLWIEVAMIASMLGFAMVVVAYQRRISRSLKEQVFQQKELIAAIVQNAVEGIIFIDNDNTVKTWNKGAERIFGYTAEEMLGSRFRRLVPPEIDAQEELGRIQRTVYEQGHLSHYQTQRLTKSGRRITVNISRSLVHDEDGNPIGSSAIIHDVTDKIEMDKHIYHTEKLASIGILAAGVAHEINNPLAIILGFADLLKDKFPKGSPEREDLDMIEENANHAKAIVENLLGFARITEGAGDAIDVNSALDMVVAIVRNTLMTKKIDLETRIDPGLPPVVGDTREFQQVIFNLINNATAAMADSGTLTIAATRDGAWVRVQVADTGSGIPNRIKAQIFDPFFTTKQVGKGTGLGLSLCYGIVQKYGGAISFVSNAKEDRPDVPSGTVFTVSMPVQQQAEQSKGADS